jgi:hypothetical protein
MWGRLRIAPLIHHSPYLVYPQYSLSRRLHGPQPVENSKEKYLFSLLRI